MTRGQAGSSSCNSSDSITAVPPVDRIDNARSLEGTSVPNGMYTSPSPEKMSIEVRSTNTCKRIRPSPRAVERIAQAAKLLALGVANDFDAAQRERHLLCAVERELGLDFAQIGRQ